MKSEEITKYVKRLEEGIVSLSQENDELKKQLVSEKGLAEVIIKAIGNRYGNVELFLTVDGIDIDIELGDGTEWWHKAVNITEIVRNKMAEDNDEECDYAVWADEDNDGYKHQMRICYNL